MVVGASGDRDDDVITGRGDRNGCLFALALSLLCSHALIDALRGRFGTCQGLYFGPTRWRWTPYFPFNGAGPRPRASPVSLGCS